MNQVKTLLKGLTSLSIFPQKITEKTLCISKIQEHKLRISTIIGIERTKRFLFSLGDTFDLYHYQTRLTFFKCSEKLLLIGKLEKEVIEILTALDTIYKKLPRTACISKDDFFRTNIELLSL